MRVRGRAEVREKFNSMREISLDLGREGESRMVPSGQVRETVRPKAEMR